MRTAERLEALKAITGNQNPAEVDIFRRTDEESIRLSVANVHFYKNCVNYVQVANTVTDFHIQKEKSKNLDFFQQEVNYWFLQIEGLLIGERELLKLN